MSTTTNTTLRIVLLISFIAVAIGGFELQVAVKPPDDRLDSGGSVGLLLPWFFCFLAWLTSLLYLGGMLIFGSNWRWWHGLVFAGCGALLGGCDGGYFLFVFGTAVGLFCGAVLGVLIHAVRYITVRARPTRRSSEPPLRSGR